MMKRFKSWMNGMVLNAKRSSESAVNWRIVTKKISPEVYDIHLMAIIKYPWHIMSQLSSEDGPLPTLIIFFHHPQVSFHGVEKEIGNMKEAWDERNKAIVWYYDKAVDFVQRVQVQPSSLPIKLEGRLFYLVCNDYKCLPSTEWKFQVDILK